MNVVSDRLPALPKWADWKSNQSGNVAVIFALMAVVLMLAVGAAVDIGRWLHARDQTVAAVDAAVLAGGRYLQTNNTDTAGAIATAQKFYSQNIASRLPVTGDTISFAVGSDGMSMAASGTAYIQTPFLQLASIDKLPLISTAQTQFSQAQLAVGGNGGSNLEVSMILDLTGSMAGQKVQDLKDAATDLVNIVIWDDQSEFTSKVALVPYSMGVNVGSTYAAKVRGNVTTGTNTSPGYTSFKFTNADNQSKTFAISNCVSERTGTNAYTDVAPSTSLVGRNYASPTNPCLTAAMTPLSSDKTLLATQIAAYTAGGSTAGQVGVAWGWYLLSPNFGYLWPAASRPAPYSDVTTVGTNGKPKLQKIAILMTDGEYNSAYCNGVISKDSTSGSGASSEHINCNATNGSAYSQATKMCTAMKTAGVTVYTVGFEVVNSVSAQNLMSQCATDSGKVYLADDGDQLKQAFRDIALKLTSLYLSQ